MPKQEIDYKNTIIYKIVCKDINIKDLYVGSTTNFIKRKYCHKSRCNNIKSKNYNSVVYKFIRDNKGWNNWDMIMVEEYPCENNLQKLQRERYWIETLQAKLNIQIPILTKEEIKD